MMGEYQQMQNAHWMHLPTIWIGCGKFLLIMNI